MIEDKFYRRVNNVFDRLILHKCMNFRNEWNVSNYLIFITAWNPETNDNVSERLMLLDYKFHTVLKDKTIAHISFTSLTIRSCSLKQTSKIFSTFFPDFQEYLKKHYRYLFFVTCLCSCLKYYLDPKLNRFSILYWHWVNSFPSEINY